MYDHEEDKLSDFFIDELFKCMFSKKSILKVCLKHLEYRFIPKALVAHKFIYKSIKNQLALKPNSLPSFGVVSQEYQNKPEVQETLARIKNTDLPDEELILNQLQKFIKEVEFQLLVEDLVEDWDDGDRNALIGKIAEESDRIHNISLRESSGGFHRLYADFEESTASDSAEDEAGISEKMAFHIDPIDDLTMGGLEAGEAALIIARSGVGKSTALRWVGMRNALMGKKVLHIQLEGSEDHVRRKYNQIWTNSSFVNVRGGEYSERKMKFIKNAIRKNKSKEHDLFIYTYSNFGEATMPDIRQRILEYEKINGYFPDWVIIDSMNLAATGLNKKIDTDPSHKKDKLKKVSEQGVDIAKEFNTRVLTATQSRDVAKEKYDDPDFHLDRNYTEGDRTLVQAFDVVFSINMTTSEERKNRARLYVDKLRSYGVKERSIPIATRYEIGHFYDRKRTLSNNYSKEDI